MTKVKVEASPCQKIFLGSWLGQKAMGKAQRPAWKRQETLHIRLHSRPVVYFFAESEYTSQVIHSKEREETDSIWLLDEPFELQGLRSR
mmetsp:Transcript_31186/g.61477  ORF Transcript_31186/g.61477 Transcript_31186/m.61477 type:complete len:89 (-) Transcript_31186:160-426(-)